LAGGGNFFGERYSSFISNYLGLTADLIRSLEVLGPQIADAARTIETALRNERKIIFCGNGGSAADAQHLSAELMGRFLIDRSPMAALSLTVDTSALTAIGNDYGFDEVFARQLRGIATTGDVVFGMSTSGNSTNVVKAFEAARKIGVTTIGLTGQGGGRLAPLSDVLIAVPDSRTSHVQEAHITIGHIICAIVEEALCSPKR
jgi:D-sedoheptulose 7-phosphate isomerase